VCFLSAVGHKSDLTHPCLRLKRGIRRPERDRGVFVMDGIAPRNRSLQVNDSSLDTMACALLERMYFCKVGSDYLSPPQPAVAHIFRTLSKFRSRLLRYLGRGSTPVSTESFVLMYQGRKRKIYEAAETNFHLYGVTRKDAQSIMFVKLEKVNPTKAPRCIQPRTPLYNLALGVYLKPIEHRVYAKIQQVFKSETPVVFKGLNVEGMASAMRGKWEKFSQPVAVGLDATKFDMHVSTSMLKWEHSIYVEMFGGSKELSKLLSWQINNVGKGYAHDGKLDYKVQGRRFSGDMNTAMGNCLIMCAMIYSWSVERGTAIELANNGDDCIVIMEQRDLPLWEEGLQEWFLHLGFRMVVEQPVYTFEHIEFCQMHPVLCGEEYRMVRNFSSAREKDSMCLLNLRCESDWRKWMGAVGECGLALCSGVPVFQAYYQYMANHGLQSKMNEAVVMQSGMLHMSFGLESKVSPVLDSTRYSFYKAFDITPDEQLALEKYYAEYSGKFGGFETIDSLDLIQASPF